MRILISTSILLISFSFSVYAQGIADTTDILPDSLVVADTLIIRDTLSLKEEIIVDDPAIYYSKYLYEFSYQINRDVFIRNDYTYTGNFLEPFQFNFIRHLGTPGQSHETFIYGVGFKGVSYLQDGILINDRLNNSLDLNLVQSEDIETIEIIPSPRGFLYGTQNNPVAVNFITRDFIPPQPYSRIKYYQGSYGEAMVDGSFNALVSRKLQFSFDVTNRKYDSSYTNTAFSTWMAKVRARYYFDNNLFLTANYNYADKQSGNWQGIDADSILRSGVPVETLLYEPDFAPVVNSFGKTNELLHNTSLRVTSIQSEDSRTEFTLYHQFYELKNGFNLYNAESDNSTLGINVSQNLGFNPFSIYSAFVYENNKVDFPNSDLQGITYKNNTFALSGNISVNLLEKISPSVFFKYKRIVSDDSPMSFGAKSLIGYGSDLTYQPIQSVTFYIGYSEFEKLIFNDRKTKNFEIAATYKYENQSADLRYFNRNKADIWQYSGGEENMITGNLSGIGLSGTTNYSYLLLEAFASKYFESKDDLREYSLFIVPEYTFSAGLYFKGNLFEDNLNLKSGIKFTHIGKRFLPLIWRSSVKVDQINRLDFILSGEIRKAAIVYFTIENFLDKKYYITPYYPMPGISLRFGLAWEFLN